MSIDVSVQICTYNRAQMALACLDALRDQTFPADRFEVVLVDDGSEDDRLVRIDAGAFLFPLRVLRVPHGGLAGARNAGIGASRGEVLLFIDDDTIPHRRLLDEHWQSHQRHPRSVVLGWVNHVNDPGAVGRRRPRLADFSTSFFWTANASVRRRDLEAAGLFDEGFTEYGWEDLEIGDRLRDLGLTRRFNRRAVVWHVKRRWRGTDVPALLRQAEASGRSAVRYVAKRPTRRARLATGISRLRMAANRLVEPGEGWYRRRVERAGEGRLRGLDWVAAYLWTRVAYFRSIRTSLGSGLEPSLFSRSSGSGLADSAAPADSRPDPTIVKKPRIPDLTPRVVKKPSIQDLTPSVVVLRVDKIGDLLVSTPALRSLRCALPDARITLVTSPECADVLRGCSAIDAIEVFDPTASRQARAQAVRKLRALQPDVIFTFTPKSSIYLLARRIGAAVRVGFGYQSRPLDRAVAHFAFTHPVFSAVPEAIERATEVPHHAEELLALLPAVGLPATPLPMEVPIREADRSWAAASFASRGWQAAPIVLHLSNKWLDDGWSPEDVVALVDLLAHVAPGAGEAGARPLVVTVGPSDVRVSSAVRPMLASRQRLLVLENLPFGRWAAVIAASALVVSPDTGAIHLASATRRPVVGVYAAHRFHIFSRQWGPWMVPSRIVAKERGAKGVEAIADAVEDLLADTRIVPA
jgi:ADP-heptose:LPS heptosyltransferase/glycosyltransferase involved in cell wall biosynthesis